MRYGSVTSHTHDVFTDCHGFHPKGSSFHNSKLFRSQPNGIALDMPNKIVYWIDAYTDQIMATGYF